MKSVIIYYSSSGNTKKIAGFLAEFLNQRSEVELIGLKAKPVALYTTYGSGAGNNRCLNYMQDSLTKKGAKDLNAFPYSRLRLMIKNRFFLK